MTTAPDIAAHLMDAFELDALTYTQMMDIGQNMDMWATWTDEDWKAYPKFRKAKHPKTAKYLLPSQKLWHFLSDPIAQRDSCRVWAGRRAQRKRSYRRDTGREVAEEVAVAGDVALAFCKQLKEQLNNQ